MKFTVVIPVYNRAREIERAIKSVLSQTFQDFEIIVVDDGSNDNTREVIESISDPRIRYVWQENAGACVARNNGIMNSLGKYISFLDSDDEWKSEMLEKQYSLFESDTSIGLVYSNLLLVNNEGIEYPFLKSFGVDGDAYPKVLEQGYLAPTSVISIRKDCFDKVGLFDKTFPASQDDDMCFRVSKYYKIGYIDTPLALMHLGPSNRISKSQVRVAIGWWMLWNKYESDVLNYCGKDVMLSHYLKCVKRFASIKDEVLYRQSLEKYRSLGGEIYIKDWISILLAGSKLGRLLIKVRRIIPFFI